uniref:Uncharacterized protein n=1 Tax=Setaria digitata TaxID=48799 RepID=A0A915Q1Y5_9BILA
MLICAILPDSEFKDFRCASFRKGKSQDPSQIKTKRRCFLFTKLLREVKATQLKSCSKSEKDDRTKLDLEAKRQHDLYNVVRESLLSRIRATV